MKFRHAAVLALGLSLLGGTGQAQQMMAEPGPSGWYLRGEGGWNHADGADIHGTTTSLAASASTDEGYIVGGALGYGFDWWRVELNIDYRNNGISSIHVGNPGAFAGTTTGSAGGTAEGTAFMVNLILRSALQLDGPEALYRRRRRHGTPGSELHQRRRHLGRQRLRPRPLAPSDAWRALRSDAAMGPRPGVPVPERLPSDPSRTPPATGLRPATTAITASC